MKKYITIISVFAFLGIAALLFRVGSRTLTPAASNEKAVSTESVDFLSKQAGDMIELPDVITDGDISLERAISLRRSVRAYRDAPLTLSELGQLLWSAQGVTNERGFRTAPSAGATFPLEMFVMVNNVGNLAKGIYHYDPFDHSLELIRKEDVAEPLFGACLSQSMILEGGAVLIFTAVYERTTARYGDRGERYILNEVGHASQNVHLQAAALDLGTVVIGAYRDDEVEDVLRLGDQHKVLYLMPVGKLL
jgi:SagB-type dehydrogenase family enzyme